MTTSSILFGVGLALLTGFYIIRPFYQRSQGSLSNRSGGERRELLEQKAAVYAAIREIDIDVQTGKLEPTDHRFLRQRYLNEGVAVLKALDDLLVADEIDAAIESDLERLRVGEPLSSSDGDVCPACGVPVDLADRFCAKCGARLRG
jgi:hypothetical protein